MGARGIAPTPTAILARRGSWRAKKRQKEGEPQPRAGCPPMPRHLGPVARACWRWVTRELEALTVLSQADHHTLERYCVLYQRWREAEAFLAAEGTTYTRTGRNGKASGFALHPEVKLASVLAEQLLKIEGQMGLTPSARTRFSGRKAPEDATDDTQRFFRVVK